ncbi:HET-domain-containing protein [Penicillium robsamsonii]|uniref:HET-domain-containing protein n=1 Tax=Penicillium robsamsonii TaxID=1792511 RepID=UPI0025466E21|nr:HET-domain-containing protein [Penicillium robsamsonii]KAJ5834324.1 HET-domain-containing protein [Penicillium robsamsonii]
MSRVCPLCRFLATVTRGEQTGIMIEPWDGYQAYLSVLDKPQSCSAFGLRYSIHTSSDDVYLGSNDDYINFKYIQDWLQECQSHSHSTSHDSEVETLNESLPSEVPFYLIDIRTLSIIEGSLGHKYAALSYVWGKISFSMLKLEVFNLQEMKLPGSLDQRWSNIPHTVRDAIVLCKKINMPFLWVDSLCIVQDSTHKSQLISNMHLVYMNATFTIAAATGNDANARLPGVEIPVKYGPIHPICATSSNSLFAYQRHKSCLETLLQSYWFSRGWTFQEHFLSQRLLCFTKHDLIFLCPESTFCQDYLTGRILKEESDPWQDGEPVYELLLSASSGGLHSPEALYDHILPCYIARSLTYDTDALSAFSGTLARFEPYLGEHWNGLHRCGFTLWLTWIALYDNTLTRREGFPSWSWVGWKWSKPNSQILACTYIPTKEWQSVYCYRIKDGILQEFGASLPLGHSLGRVSNTEDLQIERPTQRELDGFPRSCITIGEESQYLVFWTAAISMDKCRESMDFDDIKASFENHMGNGSLVFTNKFSLVLITAKTEAELAIVMPVHWVDGVGYRRALSDVALSTWEDLEPERKLVVLR